ncbi:glycosyltransferase family 4 protein [Psychroflexus maritimus]|uniref:Glycosyltransferase family 4 protein n=1 Tax=Psychroflexus maritimus TaxID=2714865 RepID=A0A967AJ60_9FLAO|nr:glycosyltransferase family 4 protein [Psychroflexus maritimus]NGZ90285.1 glycosyltransferase family 4 protein [Psychroflexus maritimus]
MNILLWAPHGSGEHYWGPGISAYRLYKSGLPDGVKVYLAHGYKEQKKYPDVFEDQFFISDLKKTNRFFELEFLWKVKKWIAKNAAKFDAVHVLGLYEVSFRPAIWFEKKGIPAFCKITSLGEGLNEQSLLSKLLGLARYRRNNITQITGFIAISEEIEKSLIDYGIDEQSIFRIPNGVDTQRFRPVGAQRKQDLRSELNLRDVFTVIFVGGISERKQPYMLAEAVKDLVKEKRLDIQLVIVGPDRDQIELKKIKNLISSERLRKNIIHIENSNEPEKYYQASDLFCLPSKREGMSNALLEAMACGLPALVTPISGSVDLVDDGKNGYYVNNKNDIIQIVMDNIDADYTNMKFNIMSTIKKYSSVKVGISHINIFRSNG